MYIMRKYYIWIVLVATLFGADATAQSLKRKVIASAGGKMASGGYQLSYTIGEPVNTKLSSGDYVLSQGFQQPDLTNAWALSTRSLLTFSAYREENVAKLQLVSLYPLPSDYLVLERIDNQSGQFEALEKLNVQFDKDIMAQQAFTDDTPQDGDNFYRVKQVFDNGTFRYTDTQKLTFTTTQVSIYPNPASDFLKVDLSTYEGKEATISLFSTNGILKAQQKVDRATRQAVQLDIDKLERGYYQVHIQVKGKKAILKQVVIQN
jgi:hypothetical protein